MDGKPYRSMKGLFKNYWFNCRRRNIFFGLTLEEFHVLTSAKCVYCARPPQMVRHNYKYNGVDRKDNSQGYTKANSVTCCKNCNSIKGQYLSYDEMIIVAQTLIKFRQRRI